MVLLARLNRTCGSKLYHLASVFSSELPLRHVRRADLVALGKSLVETAEQRVVKLTGDAGRGAWGPDGSNK